MASVHVIETLEFDVGFASEASALDRLPQLTNFLNGRAVTVIQRVFDQVFGSDRVLRVARLDIDLGAISAIDLETALELRLLEALLAALQSELSPRFAGSRANANVYSRSGAELEALVRFLQTGRFPWHTTGSLEGIAERVLRDNGPAVARLLRNPVQRDGMVRRMLRQLPQSWVEEFTRILAPAQASDFIQLAVALENVCRVERAPGGTNTGVRRIIWETLLGALLARSPRERLDVCNLARVILDAVAMSAGVQHSRRLAPLREAVSRWSRWPPRIAGLEERPAPLRELLAPDSVVGPLFRTRLAMAFETGVATVIAKEWRLLLKEQPESVKSVLLRVGRAARARRRIVAGFPQTMLVDLVSLLVPGQSSFIQAIVARPAPFYRAATGAVDDARALKPRLWEFTLTYLLVDRGSRFNKRSYLGSLIRQMAIVEGLSYGELLLAMRDVLGNVAIADSIHREILQLVVELTEIENGGRPAREFDPRTAAPQTPRVERIHAQLETALSSGNAREVTGPVHELKNRLWEFTLTFLLVDRGSAFNKRSYMSSLARQMAMHDGLTYDALLLAMRVIIRAIPHPDSIYSQMLILLAQMIEIEEGRDSPGRHAAKAHPPEKGPAEVCRPRKTVHRTPLRANETVRNPRLPSHRMSENSHAGRLPESRPLSAADVVRLLALIPRRSVECLLQIGSRAELAGTYRYSAAILRACRDRIAGGSWVSLLERSHIEELLSSSVSMLDRESAERTDQVHGSAQASGGAQPSGSALSGEGVLSGEDAPSSGSALSGASVLRSADALPSEGAVPSAEARLSGGVLPSEGALSNRAIPARESATSTGTASASGTALPPGGESALGKSLARESGLSPLNALRCGSAQLVDAIDVFDPVYIANAGMVLTAPYIPRLCAMLGLISGTAFTGLPAAERAVHLLQFMVTGSERCAEYELVLNKILCGIPIDTPIEREIDITEQERGTIEGLLQAMIRNWSAIGSTSIQGLRESFLQREGRLTCEEGQWRLQVEPKAFDMLVDRLPWGFSIVKYAWMRAVVHVDWR